MRSPDILLRNGLFYAAAALWSAVLLPLLPLALLPGGAARAALDVYLRGLLLLLKHCCGQRCEVKGFENLPPGPVLLATVHQSDWDGLFLPCLLRRPAAFARDEVVRRPLLLSMIQALTRRIARNGSTLAYLAGSRTDTMLDPTLQAQAAALYGELRLSCVPVAHDSGRFWPHGTWLRLPGTITVEIGEAIPAGLEEKLFLETLSMRLGGAVQQLLRGPAKHILMPRLSVRARRLANAMLAAQRTDGGS